MRPCARVQSAACWLKESGARQVREQKRAGAALCRAGSTAGRSLAKGWFGPGVGLQKQETTADLGVDTTGTEVGCSAASRLSPQS